MPTLMSSVRYPDEDGEDVAELTMAVHSRCEVPTWHWVGATLARTEAGRLVVLAHGYAFTVLDRDLHIHCVDSQPAPTVVISPNGEEEWFFDTEDSLGPLTPLAMSREGGVVSVAPTKSPRDAQTSGGMATET